MVKAILKMTCCAICLKQDAEIWLIIGKHEIFSLDFLNLTSCINRYGVMLEFFFFYVFLRFSKIGLNALSSLLKNVMIFEA